MDPFAPSPPPKEAPYDEEALVQSLLEHAFYRIGQDGWVAFHPSHLLTVEGVPDSLQSFSLEDIRNLLPSKEALLPLFSRSISHHLRQGSFDFFSGTSTREKLFEVFMQRFDLMAPYQSGLKSLQDFYLSSPLKAFAGFDFLTHSVEEVALLAAVPLSFSGGLTLKAIYALALKTWAEDPSPDFSQTMAHLDQLLEVMLPALN